MYNVHYEHIAIEATNEVLNTEINTSNCTSLDIINNSNDIVIVFDNYPLHPGEKLELHNRPEEYITAPIPVVIPANGLLNIIKTFYL